MFIVQAEIRNVPQLNLLAVAIVKLQYILHRLSTNGD